MRKAPTLLLVLGTVLLLCALALTVFNLHQSNAAGKQADRVVTVLQQAEQEASDAMPDTLPDTTEAAPDYKLNPEMEMPVISVEGRDYIGTLSIPVLGLELPVISAWDYPALRVAPCRYTGSAYTDNLVIAAHNYASHFGRLRELSVGDSVRFTDVEGNAFDYAVSALETLEPYAIAQMTEGDWDLTLFTCTLGGAQRVTLRCDRVN